MSKPLIAFAMLLLVVPVVQGQRATDRPSLDPWEVTELTSQPSVTLELQALTTVAGGGSVFKVRPVLVVRCADHELAVFVSTGSVLGADDKLMTPIRIQWGTDAPQDTRWSRSTDSTSAFAPDPRALVRQLASNPDLRLEIHPSSRAVQAVSFNARGLDRHLPQVDAACPPDGATPAQVYLEEMVDEHPEMVSAPPLTYPLLLRQAGLQGRVTVQAIIDTLGRPEPTSLKIIQRPSTGFEQSARDYVLHTVFRPGRVKGRAVRVLVRVPVDYKID